MKETYESLVEAGWVGTEEATRKLGLSSTNYVAVLCKTGKLAPAKKVKYNKGQHKWMVSPEAIEAYKRQPHGRKRRRYILYLETGDNEVAAESIREFLLQNYDHHQFSLGLATRTKPKNEPEEAVIF